MFLWFSMEDTYGKPIFLTVTNTISFGGVNTSGYKTLLPTPGRFIYCIVI